MAPITVVIPAANASIDIAKSCFKASVLLKTTGNLNKALQLLQLVLAEIKSNRAFAIYEVKAREDLLTLYDNLLQENSVFDTTAKSVKKRWNPVIMFNAYRHLQEARKLYIHAKKASDAATRKSMKEATIIDDPELMMDVLFGGLAGLAAKEQQGIPNTSTNVSDRATMSGPIAAGSLVDLGRSKPADRVSLANFPASSAGVSQACIPETNPFTDPTTAASTSGKAVELKNIGSKKAEKSRRR